MRILEQLRADPNEVAGIYRDPPPDLATLPPPRIDLMKLERYQPFYYPVMASRGCSLCLRLPAQQRRGWPRVAPVRAEREELTAPDTQYPPMDQPGWRLYREPSICRKA